MTLFCVVTHSMKALCSLLRRDASINFKAKGNSLVSVLACNLLMAAYEEDENWPEIFVKVRVFSHCKNTIKVIFKFYLFNYGEICLEREWGGGEGERERELVLAMKRCFIAFGINAHVDTMFLYRCT